MKINTIILVHSGVYSALSAFDVSLPMQSCLLVLPFSIQRGLILWAYKLTSNVPLYEVCIIDHWKGRNFVLYYLSYYSFSLFSFYMECVHNHRIAIFYVYLFFYIGYIQNKPCFSFFFPIAWKTKKQTHYTSAYTSEWLFFNTIIAKGVD